MCLVDASIETVFVHRSSGVIAPCKKGEFALISSPSMRLVPWATEYLHELTRTSSSEKTWRNNAYALAFWLTYCSAAGVSWESASVDNLIDFKDALASTISEQTGAVLTPGTVAARMMIVISFYVFGAEQGWYTLNHHKIYNEGLGGASRESSAEMPIGERSVRFIPKRRDSEFDIAPFSTIELRDFLSAISLSEIEGDDGFPEARRNRLLVDWGWAVGLRASELARLNIHQFLSLSFSDRFPFNHTAILILGKGAKTRNVSVPNWLISNTIKYIENERTQAVRDGGLKNGAKTELFVSKVGSTRAGKPISVRRMEYIVTSACVRAGLVDRIEVAGRDGVMGIKEKARHCVHDLRHTYAVLTYWSEVASGNAEPWKKIQAQLGHRSLETTKGTYLRCVDAHAEFQSGSVRRLIGLPIVER